MRDPDAPDPANGYTLASVVLHWIGALAVIAGIVSLWTAYHVSVGLCIALILIVRVIVRFHAGFPRVGDWPIALSLVSRLSMITLLLAMMALAISGPLMPMAGGTPYQVFGFQIGTVSWDGNGPLLSFLDTVHTIAAWALYGALALHLLFALRALNDRSDGVLRRIMRPLSKAR